MKLPYFQSLGKATLANKQNSRGGACTTYYSGFDPEANIIVNLRNPRSTEDKKNRDLHYALMTNTFFAQKVAKNEEAFSFNTFTAPDLMEAFFSGDEDLFASVYEKYENDPYFKKKYFKPRDLLLQAMNEAFETGVAYLMNVDEVNRHTPFKEIIYSSNLCVAPETKILTKEYGNIEISTISGKDVHVWNGEQWSKTKVVKTGENQKLVSVVFDEGSTVDTTLYHKWHIEDLDSHEGFIIKRTHELTLGDKIVPYSLVDDDTIYNVSVISVIDNERHDDTYCVNEPLKHRVIFNGVLSSQCLEIVEPTKPYYSMEHLYSTTDVGYIIIKDEVGVDRKYTYSDKVELEDGSITWAGNLKPGNVFYDPTTQSIKRKVKAVVECLDEPEVALCSLAAIPVTIEDDDEYFETMYLALKMIDYCILNSEFKLNHIGFTSKQRMNAGVGMLDLATHMAKKKLSFDTHEGLQEVHRISERHMYMAIKASLKIAKERGNAPWIHKTKWVDGWLPIDSYNKNVDELGNFKNQYDWETLREEVINNKGIAHSVLVALMPSESCLSQDTLVQTKEGNLSFIDIFKRTGLDINQISLNHDRFTGGGWYDLKDPIEVNTRYGYKEVDKIWYNGFTPYLTIHLEDGSSIKASPNHKFLVKRNDTEEWVKASNLNEDDDIVTY